MFNGVWNRDRTLKILKIQSLNGCDKLLNITRIDFIQNLRRLSSWSTNHASCARAHVYCCTLFAFRSLSIWISIRFVVFNNMTSTDVCRIRIIRSAFFECFPFSFTCCNIILLMAHCSHYAAWSHLEAVYLKRFYTQFEIEKK